MLQCRHPLLPAEPPHGAPSMGHSSAMGCPPCDVIRQGSQQCTATQCRGHSHHPAQSISTERDWDAPRSQRYPLGAVGVWPGPLTSPLSGHGAYALAWPEWVAGSDLWDPSQALTWLLEHEQQLQRSRMSKETLTQQSLGKAPAHRQTGLGRCQQG